MVETVISAAAIFFILAWARVGVTFGAFYEAVSTVLLLLAMLITLRYWYPLTRWINTWAPDAGSYGAFGAYWAMFLVGCLPLIVVLSRISQQSVPRYPKLVDGVLGGAF